jgi:SAM-dependent methyltransferase
MDARYQDVTDQIRTAYDGRAAWRDLQEKADWKQAERAGFLRRLQDEGCRRLLEVGAGTGQDSVFFRDHGLDVVAIDLSPAMVAHCQEKGIDGRVMDVAQLDFPPDSFDAVYTLNCLLHVPNARLPAVLDAIAALIRPGGLLFLGLYGGRDEEGIADDDNYDPPRFFSWRTDEQIQQIARQSFDLVDFHVIQPGEIHFQSLTLRRPSRRSGA